MRATFKRRMKHWGFRVGLLVLLLIVLLASAAISVPYLKALRDGACGVTMVTKAVSAGDAVSCAEFWFSRYQTFFAALIGFLTAIVTVALMWGQTRELQRQVSADLIPYLQDRQSILGEIRRAFGEANARPERLFEAVFTHTEFSEFQEKNLDGAFVLSELREIGASLMRATVLAKALSAGDREAIVTPVLSNQSELRWLALDWRRFYDLLSKSEDAARADELYRELRQKTIDILERHNTATQQAVGYLKKLIQSASERLDRHAERVIK